MKVNSDHHVVGIKYSALAYCGITGRYRMKKRESSTRWRDCLNAAPVVGLALLPRLVCPCQMPAYAGLISSMGLAFLMETVYLFPLTAMCLTFSLGGLFFRAKRRGKYGLFAAGSLGAILLMAGKFYFQWPFAVYGGLVLLLVASLWNSWPPKKPAKLKFNPDGSISRVEASPSR